jgi:hypothetical protein
MLIAFFYTLKLRFLLLFFLLLLLSGCSRFWKKRVKIAYGMEFISGRADKPQGAPDITGAPCDTCFIRQPY